MLNPKDFPFTLNLAANAREMMAELQDEAFKSHMNHSLKATPDITGVNLGWLKGSFKEDRGEGSQGALSRLVSIYKKHPVIGKAYYSCLTPGAKALFSSPDDSMLRMHFGLMIPDGDCGIMVGEKEYKWAKGLAFLFDPSLGAKVWNKTKFPRLILAFDLNKKYL